MYGKSEYNMTFNVLYTEVAVHSFCTKYLFSKVLHRKLHVMKQFFLAKFEIYIM